jgi:DNA polymerase delta subunit 4
MPPRRRAVGPKTSAQPTLSFNNRAGKVTKPASTHTSKANENAAAKAEKLLEPVEIDEPTTTSEAIDAQIEEVPTTSELAIRAQTEQQKQEPTSQAEVKAAKITDVQIKTYWKVKEDERRAPRGRA